MGSLASPSYKAHPQRGHDGADKGSSSALSLSSLLFSSLLLPSLFSLSLSSSLLLSSLLFSLSAVNHPEKGVGAPPGASVNIGLLETLEFCSVKILNDSRYDLTTAGCQVSTDDVGQETGRAVGVLRTGPSGNGLGLIPTRHPWTITNRLLGEERVASASHTNVHSCRSSLDLKPNGRKNRPRVL